MINRIAFVVLSSAVLAAGTPVRAGDPLPTVPNAVNEARAHDVPYSSLLSRAWKGDEDGIGAMFEYQVQGFFEGKGKAEKEHVHVLWSLLKHHGDDRFIEALDREDPRVQAQVVRAIALEAGPDLAKYPKTAARRNADK
jgi:hypothetical protein